MAGFGCCTGEDTFGGGTPSSGGLRLSEEITCDPYSSPSNDFLQFGQQDKWPEWMKAGGRGCGVIAILKHDEFKFGNKRRKIYTLASVKFLEECFKKNCKEYGRSGNLTDGITIQSWPCFVECKRDLMETLGVMIDPSSVAFDLPKGDRSIAGIATIPDTLCPPLCDKVEVVLVMHLWRDSYWAWWNEKKERWELQHQENETGHVTYGTVTSCKKGEEVCFDVTDFEPQALRKGRICVGADGHFTEDTFSMGKFARGVEIGPKGSCDYISSLISTSNSRRSKEARKRAMPKKNSSMLTPCIEHDVKKSYITAVYLEKPKTQCEDAP